MTIRRIHIALIIGRLLLLAGVLLLVGCYSDSALEPELEPTPVPEQHAISFAGSLPEETEVTRAAGLETVVQSFKVWAYKDDATNAVQTVMPGFNVNWVTNTANTTTSNSSDWEYVGQGTNQEIKYWDMSAQAYHFFGYASGTTTAGPPEVPASTVTVNTSSTGVVTMSAAVDATDDAHVAAAPFFSEVWYTDDVAASYTVPVVLTFLKPFCRVRFMFTFTEPGVYRSDVNNKSFAPTENSDDNPNNNQVIPRSGTVTVTYPLTGSAKETYAVTGTDNANKLMALTLDYYESSDTSDPYRQYWYTLIPPTSQGDYKLTCTIFGQQKEVYIPSQYMQWKPGFQYTYRFKVNDKGGITLDIIQVGINQWVAKGSTERPVYNW